MRWPRVVGVRLVLLGILWLGLMGLVTFGLWNWLVPRVLRLPAINFWQALGLLLLCRVLFGRVGNFRPWVRKARFVRGWKNLTPEERQRFRRAMGTQRPGDLREDSAANKV